MVQVLFLMLGVFLLQQLEVVEVAITILTKTGLLAALVVVQKAGEYMGLVALVLQDKDIAGGTGVVHLLLLVVEAVVERAQ